MFRSLIGCRSRHNMPVRRFASHTGGNVAMIFGLLTFITFTFMGAAVDMGRWLQARSKTIDAMEAATLAGLRNFQENGDTEKAEALAKLVYNANTRGRTQMSNDNVSFKLENNGGTISLKAQGNAEYNTLFLAVMPQMLNLKTLPMLRKDNSEHPMAMLAVGKNSGTSLEVAMMLDITGSMGNSDSGGKKKIDALKESAKKLIDIVIWEDQSEYTSKVALVPFSDAINLGTARANIARGAKPAPITANTNSGSSRTWTASNECVTERKGTFRFTDTSFATAKAGVHRSTDGSCATKSVVMPLDSDKTILKSTIDGFEAQGYTAGELGTEWAWYTLAPNMNSLWGNAKHHARPYAEVSMTNDKGRPVLNKIAILMTDGEYNMQFCTDGRPDRNSGYGNSQKGNCTAANGSAKSQALALCAEMKKDNKITVYTIGFMVGSSEKTMLETCATSKEHFYPAEDGAQLQQAFTDIAYKLVPPFVAH